MKLLFHDIVIRKVLSGIKKKKGDLSGFISLKFQGGWYEWYTDQGEGVDYIILLSTFLCNKETERPVLNFY